MIVQLVDGSEPLSIVEAGDPRIEKSLVVGGIDGEELEEERNASRVEVSSLGREKKLQRTWKLTSMS